MRLRVTTPAGVEEHAIDAARVTVGDLGGEDVVLARPARIRASYQGVSLILHRHREVTIAEPGRCLPTHAELRRNGRTLEQPAVVAPGDRFTIHRPEGSAAVPPPDTWVEVADAGDPAAAAAIATDPSTPIELLLLLAPTHGAAFFANPALERALADPAWLAAQSSDRICALLDERRMVPTRSFLRAAAEHASDYVRLHVLRHPATPADVIDALWPWARDHTDRSHGHAIALHPNTPRHVLDEVAQGDSHWKWSLAQRDKR